MLRLRVPRLFELVARGRKCCPDCSHAAPPRILFVGQAPGPNTQGRPALDGESGRKLARLFGHERVADFADAVNLLPYWPGKARSGTKGCRFPMREARMATPDVLAEVRLRDATSRTLGLDGPPCSWSLLGDTLVGLLPHTSGANHWWNPESHRQLGRAFARRALAALEHRSRKS